MKTIRPIMELLLFPKKEARSLATQKTSLSGSSCVEKLMEIPFMVFGKTSFPMAPTPELSTSASKRISVWSEFSPEILGKVISPAEHGT